MMGNDRIRSNVKGIGETKYGEIYAHWTNTCK